MREGEKITGRQREILEFIKEFISESGYPPTLREICARFRIKGPKNAGKHLEALERKGFIRRSARISRAIEVVGSSLKGGIEVPIAGRVRAGSPHLAVEDIVGRVVLDARFFKCRDAFMLRVEGQSMTGAGIDEGDFLIVRPQKDASDGDIVVALLDGDATVKRFSRDGDAVVLRPENPSMEPIRVTEGTALEIIGKVISIIKQVD
ncbi:MAG: transcriptional repressor LexA [Thermodesulfobacteriota bacterium]